MFKGSRSILVLSLASCITLLPREQRQIEIISPTTLSKGQAYERALTWFAKNLNNANAAVQIRDSENAHIVSNMRLPCDGLVTAMNRAFVNHFVEFSIDFQAKDNKVRLRFEDVAHVAVSTYGSSAGQRSEWGPQSPEDLNTIQKTCIDPLVADFLKGLGRPATDF